MMSHPLAGGQCPLQSQQRMNLPMASIAQGPMSKSLPGDAGVSQLFSMPFSAAPELPVYCSVEFCVLTCVELKQS